MVKQENSVRRAQKRLNERMQPEKQRRRHLSPRGQEGAQEEPASQVIGTTALAKLRWQPCVQS